MATPDLEQLSHLFVLVWFKSVLFNVTSSTSKTLLPETPCIPSSDRAPPPPSQADRYGGSSGEERMPPPGRACCHPAASGRTTAVRRAAPAAADGAGAVQPTAARRGGSEDTGRRGDGSVPPGTGGRDVRRIQTWQMWSVTYELFVGVSGSPGEG